MIRPGFAHGGAALLRCLLLTACNQSSAPASNSITRQQQTVDGITVTLEMAAEPELNRPYHFVVTLSDAQGQFVDAVDVYLELEMTAHPMGSNKPIATAQGAGTYDVEAVYTMTGPWAITVFAELDGKTYRATFNTTVEEPLATP